MEDPWVEIDDARGKCDLLEVALERTIELRRARS
jgi:hypothetical protein